MIFYDYLFLAADPEQQKALNTFSMLIFIVKREGFASLYRGIIPVLESLGITCLVYFYLFHSIRAIFNQKPTAAADLLIGCFSGAINVLLCAPLQVVNNRLKMKGLKGDHGAVEYNSLVQGILHIRRTEGAKALYSGLIPGLMLVTNPAIQMMWYEALKRKFPTDMSIANFAMGALAKAVATCITYPLQLIQTKLRVSASKDVSSNSNGGQTGIRRQKYSMFQMFLRIIRTQGILGLYRGLEAKLWQTVLTAALQFMIYEKIVKFVMSILMRPKIIAK